MNKRQSVSLIDGHIDGPTIMTDGQVVKNIERCAEYSDKRECGDCPYIGRYQCVVKMMKDTIALINRQKAEIERLTLELEGIYGGVDLYKREYDIAQEEIERLKAMNQAKLDTIHDLMAEVERLKPFEKKVLEPVIKEFQRRDCPFSPFDEYCTGHCVNCENRLEWVDCSKRLKSEAYREFWDKLKKEADFISGGDYGFSFEIREDVAEDIIKELAGE